MKEIIKNIRLKEGYKKFLRAKSEINSYKDYIKKITYFLPEEADFKTRLFCIENDYFMLYNVDNYDIKFLVNKFLVKSNNALNSVLLKDKNMLFLILKIKELTSFLPESTSISQRWHHIKNDIYYIPKCICCGNNASWHVTEYNQYCTQKCWSTSETHSKGFSNLRKTFPEVTKEEHARRGLLQRGRKASDETKKKISDKLKGNKNNLGKRYTRTTPSPFKGIKRPELAGKNSPMFGKSPARTAGFGINGYFNKQWFRSSLELFFLIQWFQQNQIVKSAESSKYRVKYTHEGLDHTYTPDFEVNSTVYEIKPHNRINEVIIQKKFHALKNLFPDAVMITEMDLTINLIDIKNQLTDYIESGLLVISEKNLKRLPNAITDTRCSIKKGKI